MKKASWILLTVFTLLFLMVSTLSLFIAYGSDLTQDVIVQTTTLADLNLDPAVVTAMKGRRGTAAALGLGFGTLLLCIILGPYRAGDRWAWIAIFLGMSVFTLAAVIRVPLLGTWLGAGPNLVLMALFFIALLLDFKRLSAPRI